MKAAVLLKYGSAENLEVTEIAEPTASDLKNGEVLIDVKASSVNPVDYKVRKGRLKWVMSPKFPKVMGSDFSGTVIASKHHLFNPGDDAFGYITTTKGGAYAEKLIMRGKKIGRKPEKLTHQETAVLPIAGITALQALRNLGQISDRQKILINGCAGGVGHLAVQVAKYYHAEVTGICSTSKVDYARSIGADKIIDYKKGELREKLEEYHIIFDTVGSLSFKDMKKHLLSKGTFIATNVFPDKIWATLSSIFSAKKAKIILANANHDDFQVLSNLCDQGHLKPFIEKEYTLGMIAEAQRHLEQGHTQGKIAITIS